MAGKTSLFFHIIGRKVLVKSFIIVQKVFSIIAVLLSLG
jgi:hypothetical protein